MNKKIIYIVIVIVVVCAGIVIGKNALKKENVIETSKEYNKTVNENKIENSVSENKNNEIENKIENDITNTNEEDKSENNISEDIDVENKEGATEKQDKEKAIEIAKKDWGTDSSVYFDFDHIDSDGNYVISVRDKSTKAIFWYTVDVEKGEIID